MQVQHARQIEAEYMTPLLGLVEALAEGVLLRLANGKIIYANEAAARILGTSRAALLDATPPRLIKTLLNDQGRRMRRRDWPDARALRTGERVRDQILGLVNVRDDSVRWLVATCQPLSAEGAATPHSVMISFEDVTEVREARRRVRYLATHDSLTGLLNRGAFEETMATALLRVARRGGRFALLYIDLDRFKSINDSLGHTVGDNLLQHLARRFEKIVGSAGQLARWGGDEFLVLLDDATHAQAVAQRLIDAAGEPCEVESLLLSIGASIGVAFAPEHGTDTATLLRHADTAMYRAKEHGRRQAEVFNPAMNARLERRARLDAGLRQALDRNELSIIYQPVIDLRSLEMTGVEALLRWHSPELGDIAPSEFIALAEDTGLIVPIGEWAMRTVFAQAAEWQAIQAAQMASLQVGEVMRPPLRVALNVSARQLLWSDLANTVERALAATGALPRRLEFELTESLLLQDSTTLARNISRLREMGIQLAIDDFGTGYASLSYLLRFPISTLKIDQSFIRRVPGDRDAMSIAEAIVAMSSALGLRCIAEGVETRAQFDFLRMVDCDAIQGFLVASPLNAAQISERLLAPNGGQVTVGSSE